MNNLYTETYRCDTCKMMWTDTTTHNPYKRRGGRNRTYYGDCLRSTPEMLRQVQSLIAMGDRVIVGHHPRVYIAWNRDRNFIKLTPVGGIGHLWVDIKDVYPLEQERFDRKINTERENNAGNV